MHSSLTKLEGSRNSINSSCTTDEIAVRGVKAGVYCFAAFDTLLPPYSGVLVNPRLLEGWYSYAMYLRSPTFLVIFTVFLLFIPFNGFNIIPSAYQQVDFKNNCEYQLSPSSPLTLEMLPEILPFLTSLRSKQSDVIPLIPHAPILIQNDTEFSQQGWPGSGTPNDPYRIENLLINISSTHAITVYDTRLHFVVNQCVLASQQRAVWESGVYLENVSNVQITETHFSLFSSCIHLNLSQNNLVNNNWCENSRRGVFFEDSDFNYLVNNTLVYNTEGLNIYQGNNNTINWNVFSANLYSTSNNGENNEFDHNFWSDYNLLDNDGDGIGDSPHPVRGGPGVFDYFPLMFLPPGHPIVWRTRLNTFYLVEAGDYFQVSIEVATTFHSTVEWDVNDTVHCSIIDGLLTLRQTTQVGLYNVQVSATDDDHNTITMIFQFRVVDTRPPEWINPPGSIIFWPHIEPIAIQFVAEDPSGIDTWSIDATENFTIDQSGYLTSRGVLESDQSYNLWVSVNDTLGHETGLSFTFIIYTLRIPPLIFYVSFGLIISSILISVVLTGYWLRWKPYLS